MMKKLIKIWLTFHGGGGGGRTTTVNQMYSPEEAARRATLFGTAEDIYKQNVAAGTPTFLPPSNETTRAQNQALDVAAGPGQNLANEVSKATKFGLTDVLNPSTNPALAGTLDTATRRLNEAYLAPGGVFSNIRTNFMTGNSAGNSSREGIAQGLAARSFGNTLGDTYSSILSDAYNKGLDTFSRTMALAPSSYGVMMQPTQTIADVGAAKDAYAGAKQNWELNAPWAMLQPYANVVQGLSNPTTQSSVSGAQSSPVMGAIGGAAMGYSLASMMPALGMTGPWGAAAGAVLGLMMS